MRRFAILSLMGAVLAVAVAVAALRDANDYWAGGLLLATVLLIGTAALGAVYYSGGRRAARLGFTVFAAGYFALAFLGISDQIRAMLPTTWLLTFIHHVATPTAIDGHGSVVTQQPGQPPVTVPVSLDARRSWNSLIPGAANYEAFSVVGNCLFTLLAGLLGMGVAVRCRAKQVRLREHAD
jgi:hypothetical protein